MSSQVNCCPQRLGIQLFLFHSLTYGFWGWVSLDAHCGQDIKIKTLRSAIFGYVLRDNQVTQIQLVRLTTLCTFLIYFQKDTLMDRSVATNFKKSDAW